MVKCSKNGLFRKFALFGLLLAACLVLAACGGGDMPAGSPQDDPPPESTPAPESASTVESAVSEAGVSEAGETDATDTKEEKIMVEITMEKGGVIKLELDREAAPLTVDNFVELTNDGFYDGLIFHRVVDGFMIQGGDPTGTGMGGPGHEIKGEFSSNGWDNPISHVRGVISMARSQAPDSAGSQFFITHGDATFLDGNYAAFGTVVEGMDVVDRIATAAVSGESPVEPEAIATVRVVDA